MNFTEFFNKNKNVIKATSRNKIASSIPVTEDRNNFYIGKTFKKYDLVESDGIVYRILEKCSNYYQVVDNKGNLARKFLKDLTLSEQKEFPTMVDFAIMFDASPEIIAECKAAMRTGKKDDIALLKEVKDVENYKPKDKLTVAKIIADACGVPYDVVSTPENLVNQAIRKAAKDPAIVRNKELLQNMLSIAKDVGIKYSKSIFDAKGVEESVEESRDDNEIANREYHGYVDAVRTGNSEKAKELKRKVDFHRQRHIKNIMTIKEDDDDAPSTAITYKELMKLQHSAPTASSVDPAELLKHGHTFNPTSETNRRAKIYHHRGE